MLSAVLPYTGIFLAAAVEGEIVFIAASLGVAFGQLDGWGVLTAGALGGSVGDQFFFYAFRGPLGRWLDRFPAIAGKRHALGRLVKRYSVPLTAACRFLPGLRIAIPAACASTSMPAALFTSISIVSAFVWAACILGLVTAAGPAALLHLGVARNWALGGSALVVLALFFSLGRITLSADPPTAGHPQ